VCYTLKQMIRLFDLRDLPLVHRLRDQSISLHTESALTNGAHPLRSALAGMLIGRDTPTFVWKAEESDASGFVQLHLREDGEQAQIVTVGVATGRNGPDEEDERQTIEEDVWIKLLEQLIAESGQRGIHSLVAEVSETGQELVVLRRAGFVVYTRQDVWQLSDSDVDVEDSLLQARTAQDQWDISLLYANTVPRLIQLVEPSPPLHDGPGWTLREDDELVAFVHRHDGPTGSWLRLFVHPGAHTEAVDILRSVLRLRKPSVEQPLFCSVPRYQSWLQRALVDLGFVHLGSQAMMVKHTVQRVQRSVPEPASLVGAKQVARTTPYQVQKQQGESDAGMAGEQAWGTLPAVVGIQPYGRANR
jgi:hypothetical protein